MEKLGLIPLLAYGIYIANAASETIVQNKISKGSDT
jgi:hypothetical protein